MTKEELDQKIREHIRTKGEIIPVEGIFGDDEPNLAYVEEFVTNDKGLQTKFYGCDFLYKGYPDSKIIDSLALTKRVLIGLARRPWLFLGGGLGLLNEVYEADLGPKVQHFAWSPFARELLKVHPLLACLIQFDDGYRWRLLDFFGNLDKGVLGAFGLAIQRDNRLKDKWKLARLFAPFLWWKTRGLDLTKFQLDEADRYFAYRRHGYDIDGLDYDTRIAIVKKVDQERGHAIII